MPTTLRQQHILLNDHRAWVGLPVHWESSALVERRELAARSNTVKYLIEVSPYGLKNFDLPVIQKTINNVQTKATNNSSLNIIVDDDDVVENKNDDYAPSFSAEVAEKLLSRFGYSTTALEKQAAMQRTSVIYDAHTGRKIVGTRQFIKEATKEAAVTEAVAAWASAAEKERRDMGNVDDELSSVGSVSVASGSASGVVSVSNFSPQKTSLLLSDKHSLIGRSKFATNISGTVTITSMKITH